MPINIEKLITDFLIEKLTPSFIILFGSYARNTMHDQSDIDIAFYRKDSTITKYDTFMLAQELASLLKKEVDLVNITEASTVFQAQIYTTGKIIYCNDEILRMKEQMKTLSMYVKLNEERRDILKKVDESGTIYEK
ncbi:nucleotidyltransferase domain-containing protein [Terrilactibacillus sp. BCM23-1]|uniref:Nucleotidyltransferase domain-containing protein n=1 Tax=Terrilactibacillus tamarindi TaxID=2599694 RepID=A0A6N8CR64_9BACI|nr:nucleotidyltransferase domain-containing protein [Terrilactibacillus tamarindi]MTT31415.1 nucleotidyltransferase domain-containing protein [Terrilactibacillus tamarindi]